MGKPSPSRVAATYLVAKKWKKLPPGWTDKSVDKFWDTLTKGTPEHKVWDCISKMEEPFGDGAGAFCGGLADWKMPGWRQKNKKESPDARATARKYWKGKIKKNKAKKAAKKRKAIYLGLFIPRNYSTTLQRWWVKETGLPVLSKPYLHHITVKFKPSVQEVLDLKDYMGKMIPVKVTGWAADDKCQALTVKCQAPVCNMIPHITVATDSSTKPFYSNALLAKGPIHPVSGGPVFKLRLGFFDGNTDRFTFGGTIYEDLI